MALVQGDTTKAHIVVMGAGAFGGWTALELLRSGAKVTLVDPWGPGNSRASSGGETRIIRATYGPSKVYTAMAQDALQLWKENERRWGTKLFHRSGVVWMAGRDDSFERSAVLALEEAGVPFERLGPAESGKRWPQINFDGVPWVIYEPEGGYLLARRACEAVYEAFLKEGGEYQQAKATPGRIAGHEMEGVSLSNGALVQADQYVFACGPWLPKILLFLGKFLRSTRQEVYFFGTEAGDLRYTDAAWPAWVDNNTPRYYGIPGNQWRGFKIGDDTRGADFDPDLAERRITDQGLAAAKAYMEMRFPGMKGMPLVESRVCQYENSADEDFILCRHPDAENAWIVGGGSGHGFKHGPAVGAMAAAAVLGTKQPPALFGLERFRETGAL